MNIVSSRIFSVAIQKTARFLYIYVQRSQTLEMQIDRTDSYIAAAGKNGFCVFEPSYNRPHKKKRASYFLSIARRYFIAGKNRTVNGQIVFFPKDFSSERLYDFGHVYYVGDFGAIEQCYGTRSQNTRRKQGKHAVFCGMNRQLPLQPMTSVYQQSVHFEFSIVKSLLQTARSETRLEFRQQKNVPPSIILSYGKPFINVRRTASPRFSKH